jgi:hypothetical protein
VGAVWGNYGAADPPGYHFDAFTWRNDPPTDEGLGESQGMAAMAAARAAQQANAQSHDVQLCAFACLTCGYVDGRTQAGALTCHDCAQDENPLNGGYGGNLEQTKGMEL